MKAIISGGGTGGHIFPAIAVAQELKRNNKDIEILFVGAEGKMEMEKVPKAGFEIQGLWISGLQRKLTMKNLLFPVKLLSSLIKANAIVNKFKPDIVVSFGGYASGPVAQIANWKGIPLVLQEQNSFPGITNKLLASKAQKICVAYKGMEKYFEKEKIVFTGNPVRQDISEMDKDINSRAIEHFDLVQNKKTVLVFGGSLGARSLNEAVRQNFEKILGDKDVQLIWQVGKLYYDDYAIPELVDNPNVKILPFIDRMDLAYAAADLVVSRAGALTISELSLVAKAVILVPSPNVAEDHQTKNAMSLFDQNAAMLIKDVDVKEKLGDKVVELLNDEELMKKLQENIKKLGKPNAAKEIRATIENVINNK